MRYHCHACHETFESEEPRCPSCLRRSQVAPADGAGGGGAGREGAPTSLWRGPGLLVTVLIITPLMVTNRMSWHLDWWFTFVVAMVGFGAGHGVNWWWWKRKSTQD